MLRNVAALVGERAAAFELGVVSEVFGLDRTDDDLPGYDFSVCGVKPGRVETTSGYAIHVEHGLDRLEAADLIVVTSWPDHGQRPPEAMIDALVNAVDDGRLVLGVCSGAFALAASGLLDGRRCATHWRYAAELSRLFPLVQVDPDVLYVQDGPVMTSAGTAAAVDACLQLLRGEHGAEVANAVARRMVVAPHRTGGQAQFVEAPVQLTTSGDDMESVLEWARDHLNESLTVPVMAGRALMSPRTFSRRFKAFTGATPHQWVLDQRLDLAERLLEGTAMNVDRIASECGLGTPNTLRYHFARRRLVGPTAYRRTFRGR